MQEHFKETEDNMLREKAVNKMLEKTNEAIVGEHLEDASMLLAWKKEAIERVSGWLETLPQNEYYDVIHAYCTEHIKVYDDEIKIEEGYRTNRKSPYSKGDIEKNLNSLFKQKEFLSKMDRTLFDLKESGDLTKEYAAAALAVLSDDEDGTYADERKHDVVGSQVDAVQEIRGHEPFYPN